jgi:hypothetical protein
MSKMLRELKTGRRMVLVDGNSDLAGPGIPLYWTCFWGAGVFEKSVHTP